MHSVYTRNNTIITNGTRSIRAGVQVQYVYMYMLQLRTIRSQANYSLYISAMSI